MLALTLALEFLRSVYGLIVSIRLSTVVITYHYTRQNTVGGRDRGREGGSEGEREGVREGDLGKR